jgi:hypothetical protein
MSTLQVLDGAREKHGVVAEHAHALIAGTAENAANAAGGVAVIDVKSLSSALAVRPATDEASPAVCSDKRVSLGGADAKLAAVVPITKPLGRTRELPLIARRPLPC